MLLKNKDDLTLSVNKKEEVNCTEITNREDSEGYKSRFREDCILRFVDRSLKNKIKMSLVVGWYLSYEGKKLKRKEREKESIYKIK